MRYVVNVTKDWSNTLARKPKAQPQYVAPEITARSETQARYLSYLSRHPMVVATGAAGTGKTFLATSHAIDQLVADSYERLIITRATVPVSGENLGFLPGSVSEKMEPWTAELFEIIRDRVGDTTLKQLVSARRVQVIPFAYMRGRTFNDSVVICDEMQNATPAQVKMLVTRIGERSQMLLNGDLTQSDLRGKNGLEDILDMIQEQTLMIPVVHFTAADVRRSHLCQLWVNAYERRSIV